MPVTHQIALGLICLLCLTAAGWLTCLESAVLALARAPSLNAAQKRLRQSRRIGWLLDRPAEIAASCQGGKLLLLAAAVLGFDSLALRWLEGAPPLAAHLAATVASAALIAVVAEIVPRSLAFEGSDRIIRRYAGLAVFYARLTAPLGRLARSTAGAAAPPDSGPEPAAAAEASPIDADEAELIDGVLEFGETTLGEILTPRTELVAFSADLSREELLREMLRCGVRRVPIHEGDLDHIIGIMHIKRLALNPKLDLHDMLSRPLLAPETMGLAQLLADFKRERTHIAVVLDEYGATRGVVTMHDLLEEIVGHIQDESEAPAAQYERLEDGALLVAGRMPLDDLRRELGVELDDQASRTLGGLVMNRLNRMPRTGDVVEAGAWRLRVEKMAGRSVATVRLEAAEPDGGAN